MAWIAACTCSSMSCGVGSASNASGSGAGASGGAPGRLAVDGCLDRPKLAALGSLRRRLVRTEASLR